MMCRFGCSGNGVCVDHKCQCDKHFTGTGCEIRCVESRTYLCMFYDFDSQPDSCWRMQRMPKKLFEPRSVYPRRMLLPKRMDWS